ncbi:MAG: MGMT family protein [Anaerolineaceae bacterium]|jgi:methylated-DNA-protein-cysteine methyltransferase-like protein
MSETKRADIHLFPRIYAIVRQIPPGKVASYGQIASLAGCTAREVGYAMAAVKSDDIPWQRVINSQGKISLGEQAGGALQRQLLLDEGIQFDDRGRVNFKSYGWLSAHFGDDDTINRVD